MASQEIEKYRQGAEIYNGDALCKEKTKEILKELCLPVGLLPFGNGITEVGYNRAAGFMWQRRSSSYQHFFSKAGKLMKYSTEVTGFVEKHKMKKITGVTNKAVMVWVALKEVSVDDPQLKSITFKSATGLKLSFPVSTFEEEEEITVGAPVDEENKEITAKAPMEEENKEIPGALKELINK